jgi:hypothetical protein
LKDEASGSKCTVASHIKKFSPSPEAFYIKEIETKAWCKPVYNGAGFTSEQRSFLLTHRLSRGDWDETFAQLDQGIVPDWIVTAGGEKLWSSSKPELLKMESGTRSDDVVLISPKLANVETGLFQLIPALSYDSVEETPSAQQHADIPQVVAHVNDRFRHIKSKWSTAFGEIEAGYLVVIKDIQQLQAHLMSIKNSLGSSGDAVSSTSIWEQMSILSTQVASSTREIHSFMVNTAENLEKVTTQCGDFQASMQFLENETLLNLSTTTDRLATVEKQVAGCEGRLIRLLPVLQNLAKPVPTAASVDSLLRDEVQELQQRMDQLTAHTATRSSPSSGTNPELSTQVIALQAQVKLLQQRIVGDGVQIGSKVFQSFDDLRAWVPLKLSNRRYGLFVDAVSLLDFFTSVGHVDAEQTFTSFYNQKRTGFASMYEGRVAASVQNLFPMVFGKTDSSGLDTSDRLPALSDPDKWDNGATGLKYQILRSMGDVEYQMESAIDSVLADYDEAKQLAKECLFKSKRFIMELCNFMTQDFHKWMYRGHGKRDSWKMTAVSVRRIFEEMHSERVVARDGYDQDDLDFSAAKFLWATFKAHAVMAKYLKHQFYEHPAIAAVLARHLADNYVKPDTSQESRIQALDTALKDLHRRVDSLISKEAERKLQEKADKAAKAEQHKGEKYKGGKNDKGRQSPHVLPVPVPP